MSVNADRAASFAAGYRKCLEDVQGLLLVLGRDGEGLDAVLAKVSEDADRYRDFAASFDSIRKGIEEAEMGLTVDRGDFSQYLDDEDEEDELDGPEVYTTAEPGDMGLDPFHGVAGGRQVYTSVEEFAEALDKIAAEPQITYPNPLVDMIGAELEKIDGMADNTIAFVLEYAVKYLGRFYDKTPDTSAPYVYMRQGLNVAMTLLDPKVARP